jgi:NAD(P)-dependent dehydrogenase (short-subunit alcohol dehydrogenase family)
VARVHAEAPGEPHAAAGRAALGLLGHALADDHLDGARAVAEQQAQVLAAVAPPPALALADQQDHLDLLAVDELPHEHGRNARAASGRRRAVARVTIPPVPDPPRPGRTAFVTGGTGGLGPAVIEALLAAGWRVVAPRRPGSTEAERIPGGAETVEADLIDPDAVRAAMAATAGRPDAPLRAVVNLVGGYADGQPVASTPVADFEALFALNLRPTYLVTAAGLPELARAGGGSVVCVASRTALAPFAGAAGYAAANAAVLAFSRVVALEGAADGIRCNALVPKLIATPANRAAGIEGGTDPAEIARVVAWLCDDASGAVTGAEIPV